MLRDFCLFSSLLYSQQKESCGQQQVFSIYVLNKWMNEIHYCPWQSCLLCFFLFKFRAPYKTLWILLINSQLKHALSLFYWQLQGVSVLWSMKKFALQFGQCWCSPDRQTNSAKLTNLDSQTCSGRIKSPIMVNWLKWIHIWRSFDGTLSYIHFIHSCIHKSGWYND